jgi:hypothetical protein
MKSAFAFGAVCAIVIAGSCIDAQAAQGDVYVPAHRTRDGSFVPANVPPSSGGTRIAMSLGRRAPGHAAGRSFRNAIVAPIFVQAKTVTR